MIFIQRPTAEPRDLAKQRRAGLKKALRALNKHGIGSNELKKTLKRYDGGKATLFRAQHRKCAYCERRVGLEGNPLEHVRPKAEAWRHLPGSARVTEAGYWWLTWTWKNHLFACQSCNTGHKQSYFPLASGSRVLPGPASPYSNKRLRPAHHDTSVEDALLVDPSVDNPLDHIEWCPVNQRHPKRLWKWYPKHLTARGDVTIRVLGFKLLADDVGDHVRDNVIARAESICAHIDGGRHGSAAGEWTALSFDVAQSRCHLAGPTWNALHYLVDLPRRTAANLALPPRP